MISQNNGYNIFEEPEKEEILKIMDEHEKIRQETSNFRETRTLVTKKTDQRRAILPYANYRGMK